jgi:hypothetical protein
VPHPWVGVPTISGFHGITIQMYWDDHRPPHFHVRADGKVASVRIEPVEVLKGKLQRKHFSLVKRWAEIHRIDLEDNWNRARLRETLIPIEPLK